MKNNGRSALLVDSARFDVLMIWALVRENTARRRRTVEEFERDVANAKQSMMRAGHARLDKFGGNEQNKRAAVEYLKDEEQV